MGYVPRTDYQEYGAWFNPHFWAEPGQWYQAMHVWTGYERTHDYGRNGGKTDRIFVQGGNLNLHRNTWIGTGYNNLYTLYEGVEFPNQHRLNVWAGTERWRQKGVDSGPHLNAD